ncbi:MAG TPA: tetratricopeptide repeat protein [Pyrinomonadaceae bacterium]|jgi:tetratricopeptide (TPR) repeat protein
MKKAIYISTFSLLLVLAIIWPCVVRAQERPAGTVQSTEPAAQTTNDTSGNDPLRAELKAITELPPPERIAKLKAFIEANPLSALKTRAQELIVSAHAALGEEKLRAGDAAGGIEQFRRSVAESRASLSDKLFADVLARIPLNLYLRNERAAALEIARLIEERVKDNPQRLLTLVGFYLNVEEADEAARVASMVIKLAPEMPAAHQALGAARHIALKLDDAMTAYARALELDAKSGRSRRSLADLRRATGKAEAALTLYRELLQAEPGDKLARSGIVLSLFDLGRKDEAERELEAALKEEPRNLSLLTGAAYWYAAHKDGARALELAQRAVEIEPRYTWAHIALARALVAQKRPLDAEQALRFARQYGRFPTLEYELASALAAAGLYEEAANTLSGTFTLKGDQLETLLAGRTLARAASFIELLAPERRAGIFQPAVADTEENARLLKALLAFRSALNPAGGRAALKEAEATSAAREWTAGQDAMRLYRQLYAASRLLQRRVGWQAALDLSEAAKSGLEEALDVPAATVAVMADELTDARARAINYGGSLAVPDVPRNVLSSILRGRIEDLAGVALYNQDKAAEAVVRLRRAIGVLPENSAYWRAAQWHLGEAHFASGNQQEALAAYLRSYDRNAPDPVRRAVIEGLYRKVNGSLEGLEARLGAAAPVTTALNTTPTTTPAATPDTPVAETTATARNTPEAAPVGTVTPAPTPATSQPTPEPTPAEASAREQPSDTTSQPATGEPRPAATEPQPTTTSDPQPTAAEPQPTPTPDTAPSQRPRTTERPAEKAAGSDECIFNLSEEPLTLRNNGGSIIIPVSFNGAGGAASITASTPNWADIAVFSETKTNIESGVYNYSITSVSKRTGTYTVIFKSPCGTKKLTVIVK